MKTADHQDSHAFFLFFLYDIIIIIVKLSGYMYFYQLWLIMERLERASINALPPVLR